MKIAVLQNGTEATPTEMTQGARLKILAVRIQQGDVAAFTELYHQIKGLMMGVITRIIRHVPEAEDVFQETFVMLYHQFDKYDPAKGEILGWVITFTRCRAIDRARRLDTYGRTIEKVTWTQKSEESFSVALPETEYPPEWIARVRELISHPKISPGQSACLRLHYVMGMTHTEVSAHLKIPLGTVKGRLTDGLKKVIAIVKTDPMFSAPL
jgi:RNA polymerase sigma-70 factor (ECF subfamily)